MAPYSTTNGALQPDRCEIGRNQKESGSDGNHPVKARFIRIEPGKGCEHLKRHRQGRAELVETISELVDARLKKHFGNDKDESGNWYPDNGGNDVGNRGAADASR